MGARRGSVSAVQERVKQKTVHALKRDKISFVLSRIDNETARLEKRLHALKIKDKITIDGRLDEPDWAEAPGASEFTQREPIEGEPASERTEIRVLMTTISIFGVIAKDKEAGHIIISLRKDFSVNNGDSIQIVLDTFHDERNAYQYRNPVQDFQIPARANSRST